VKLRNAFTVPALVDEAWAVLLDLERVAPCMPGAELDGGDGGEFTGRMAVRIGPVTSRYRGTVRIEEADADARRAVIRAQARDASGAGTAAATIVTEMSEAGDGTRVEVETELQISGPAAQFGRGVMQEVSAKLMERFAAGLAEEMGADGHAATVDGAGSGTAGPEAVGRGAGGPGSAASGAAPRGVPDVPTIDWSTAVPERAPTRLGAYDLTPVGRLPTGPAGDAALAAAGAGPAAAGAGPAAAGAGRAAAGAGRAAAGAGRAAAGAGRAAAGAGGTSRRERRSADVLDLGEISRGALLRRAIPAAAVVAVVAAATAGGIVCWRRRAAARYSAVGRLPRRRFG